YGVLGSDRFDSNLYLGLLNGEATYVFDGALANGFAIGALPNPDLKWEEARKFDLGLDLNFFNDKLEFVADYFKDTRANLLIPNIPVSGIVGTYAPGGQNPTLNAGDVENKGFEFALTYNDYIGDDFHIKASYNVTFIKNTVTS